MFGWSRWAKGVVGDRKGDWEVREADGGVRMRGKIDSWREEVVIGWGVLGEQ